MPWLLQYYGGGIPLTAGVERCYEESVQIQEGRGIARCRNSVDYLAQLGYLPIVEFSTRRELKMRLDPQHMIDLSRQGLGPLSKLDENTLDQVQTMLKDGNADGVMELAGVMNAYSAPINTPRPARVQEILDRHFSGRLPETNLEYFPGAAPLPPPVPHPDNNENPAQVADPGVRRDDRAVPNQTGRQGTTEDTGDSLSGPDADAIQVQHELFGHTGNESVTPTYNTPATGTPTGEVYTGETGPGEATEVSPAMSGAEISDTAVEDHTEQ